MTDQVRRDVVKLGLDFTPIPVDLGDGIIWEFHPDPSPSQWSGLMDSLKSFTRFEEKDYDGEQFKEGLQNFTKAMSELLVSDEQKAEWIERQYGLGPQQAISQALMGIWTGFPTTPSSPSGKGSRPTG